MLFKLLPACITILLFFFLFLTVFKSFFTNPDVNENVRPQLASNIAAGAPIRAANDAIEILPATRDKKINHLLKYSKEAISLLRFLLISSLSQISAIK